MLRSDVVVQTGKPNQFWQSTNQAQADNNLEYGGKVIQSIKNKGNAFDLNKGSFGPGNAWGTILSQAHFMVPFSCSSSLSTMVNDQEASLTI